MAKRNTTANPFDIIAAATADAKAQIAAATEAWESAKATADEAKARLDSLREAASGAGLSIRGGASGKNRTHGAAKALETEVLRVLKAANGKPLSRAEIMAEIDTSAVWGENGVPGTAGTMVSQAIGEIEGLQSEGTGRGRKNWLPEEKPKPKPRRRSRK